MNYGSCLVSSVYLTKNMAFFEQFGIAWEGAMDAG